MSTVELVDREESRTAAERPAAADKACLYAHVLLAAYCSAAFLGFAYVRFGDVAALSQATFLFVYALAVPGAISIAVRSRMAPAHLAVPVTLVLMILYPLAAQFAGWWAAVPLAVLSVEGGRTTLVSLRSQSDAWRPMLFTFAGALLGISYFFYINGMGYTYVFGDQAAALGIIHWDSLFHSAIINMISEHGAASTGLHGLPPLAYHVGVHHWMAALSTITGGNTLLLVAAALQIMLFPLLLYVAIYSSMKMALTERGHVVLFFIMMIVFVLSQSYIYAGYLRSESYALSLLFMVAALPIGMRWISSEPVLDNRLFAEVTLSLALVFAAGIAKMSVGFVLAAFFGLCFSLFLFRIRTLYAVLFVLGWILLGLAVCAYLYVVYLNPELMPFDLGHFASTRYWTSLWVAFAICLAAFVAVARLGGMPLAGGLVMSGTFIAAAAPPLLFAFAGAGGLYFVHPALLMAIMLAVSALAAAFARTGWLENRAASEVSMMALLLGIVAYFVLIPGIESYRVRIADLEETLRPHRAEADQGGGEAADPEAARSPPPLQALAREAKGLSQAHGGERALLYVPPGNASLWGYRPNRVCWTEPLAIPAVTGFPMLAGVRGEDVGCANTQHYGMVAYGEAAANRALDRTQACTEAMNLGFSVIYRVPDGARVERIDCAAPR